MKAALAPVERNTNIEAWIIFGAPARSDDLTPGNFYNTIYREPHTRNHG